MLVLFAWETPLVNPWPPVHFLTLFTTLFTFFSSSFIHWSLLYYSLFHHTINHFVFCETGEIDNLSAVGGKVIGWVCAGPRLLKVKHQRSSTFTSLLISKSSWFDKPRFNNWGKILLLATSLPSPRAKPNTAPTTIRAFSGAVAGDFVATARGVSYSQPLYSVFVLLVFFLV